MTIKQQLAERAAPVEAYLAGCLRDRDFPANLLAAMEYSLLAGGKRLRPVLVLSFCTLNHGDAAAALPFAAALECIHTYSLIHDDLPAMDDDDLRRGRPSNHKQFGEAQAILAGDGLNTEAFTLACEACSKNGLPATDVLRAVAALARAAGAAGMVGGQTIDMELTGAALAGREVSLPQLRDMHARKTGALITAACVCGAILSGAGAEAEARARRYGRAVGVAFQIADDILDVVGDQAQLGKPVGSDEAKGKTTYPSLLGLESSRVMAREQADLALEHLAAHAGPEADFLRALARYIVDRAC
ncbi:MAG: polyprenyl synthetase family protein [Desulfovibrionaceae bacterium]